MSERLEKNIKADFIEYYMASRVVAYTSLVSLFKKTLIYENKYQKDCSRFVKSEILGMYKNFGARSLSVLGNYNVYLKSYTAYKIKLEHADFSNEYEKITKEDLAGCLDPELQKQLYLTREQLDDIEDELLNYTDKAIVEALWHGISGDSMKDLVNLNSDMLSAGRRTLHFPDGREILISGKLSQYLELAFEETNYLCYGPSLRVVKLVGAGRLYKERSNAYALMSDDVGFRWVYRKIQIFRKYLDIKIFTMKTIQASGLLNKLSLGMKKANLSLRDYLNTEEGKGLATQYGFNERNYVDVLAEKYKYAKFT